MKIKCEVQNVPELMTYLNTLAYRIGKSTKEMTDEMANNTMVVCQEMTPVHSGKMKESYRVTHPFHGESWATADLTITDKDAVYILNGTGIYADVHSGHTKTFVNSNYSYWYLPEWLMPGYEKYNYPTKEMNGFIYIRAHGQRANNFLLRGYEQTKEKNISTANSILSEIVRTLKV